MLAAIHSIAAFTILLIAFVVFTESTLKSKGGGGGTANIFRTQDVKGNYQFGYDITDDKGATNFRQESGDGKGNVVGSYGLTDVDGRTRVVEYAADKNGFTAAIETNEPGTSDADAADATYNGVDKNTKQFSYTVQVEDTPKYDDGKYKPSPPAPAKRFMHRYAAASEPTGQYQPQDQPQYELQHQPQDQQQHQPEDQPPNAPAVDGDYAEDEFPPFPTDFFTSQTANANEDFDFSAEDD